MHRREGASTLGLWLPLALASLVQSVVGLFGKPPATSELLGSWMLPHLAAAMRREEEAARAGALGDWLDGLERRFGRSEDGER